MEQELKIVKRFGVLIYQDPEDNGKWYTVECPILGCASQGKTRDEALANIKEAIEGTLETMKANNMPIPISEFVEVDVEV